WRKVVSTRSIWHCTRHVHESLGRLSNRNMSDHLIAQGVNRDRHLTVLQRNIDPGTIARRPKSVRKVAYRYSSDQLRRGAPTKGLHFVRSADGDISKLAIMIVDKVHMIGDRSGIE